MKLPHMHTAPKMMMLIICISLQMMNATAHPLMYSPDGIEYNARTKQTQTRNNITLSAAFENDYYAHYNRVGHFYTEVVAGNTRIREERRIPLNISLVIDRSGSMAGDKIRNAKKAAKNVIEQLNEDDYVSIVIYDGSVDVLQETIHPYNKQSIKNKIDNIYERGGTNLMGGAMKGYELVKRKYRNGYVNRVLLLSDGLANEGITDPRQIERIVRKYNNEDGISISTFGVGADYNEDLMTAMAEAGTGNYYYIKDAAYIASILNRELSGYSQLTAQNVTLKIKIPDYVTIEKVYGAKYDQVGRNIIVNMRDIFANETKGLLLKYRINGTFNLPITFDVSLSYTDAYNERDEKMYLTCTNEYTGNDHVYKRSYNEWVSTQVALYESNEILENAMKEVDKGNFGKAKEMVRDNQQYLESKKVLVDKSAELKKATTTNVEYEKSVDMAPAMSTEDVKYMQKAAKSESYQIRNKK